MPGVIGPSRSPAPTAARCSPPSPGVPPGGGWCWTPPGTSRWTSCRRTSSNDWTPGDHRVQANTASGRRGRTATSPTSAGSASPDHPRFRAAGVGLESIFDWRIVHNEWADAPTVPEHLETLLNDLQVLQGGGDMGFDASVTATGTFTNEPLLSTCLGVVAADFIRELAGRGAGFDWWIDIDHRMRSSIAKPQPGRCVGGDDRARELPGLDGGVRHLRPPHHRDRARGAVRPVGTPPQPGPDRAG